MENEAQFTAAMQVRSCIQNSPNTCNVTFKELIIVMSTVGEVIVDIVESRPTKFPDVC